MNFSELYLLLSFSAINDDRLVMVARFSLSLIELETWFLPTNWNIFYTQERVDDPFNKHTYCTPFECSDIAMDQAAYCFSVQMNRNLVQRWMISAPEGPWQDRLLHAWATNELSDLSGCRDMNALLNLSTGTSSFLEHIRRYLIDVQLVVGLTLRITFRW